MISKLAMAAGSLTGNPIRPLFNTIPLPSTANSNQLAMNICLLPLSFSQWAPTEAVFTIIQKVNFVVSLIINQTFFCHQSSDFVERAG